MDEGLRTGTISYTCPECGHPLRLARRAGRCRPGGRSHSFYARREDVYVCPVAVAEECVDGRGYPTRVLGARHPFTRGWPESALAAPTDADGQGPAGMVNGALPF